MKSIAMTWLVAGSLLAGASPGAAADLGRTSFADARSGTFAGARFRLALGRGKETAKARVGLTVAPMLRTQGADGRTALRIGDGVGLGFAGSARPQLMVGGRSLAAFGPQRPGPNKDRAAGVSTLGAVGIGAGVLLLAGVVYYAVLTSGCYECED